MRRCGCVHAARSRRAGCTLPSLACWAPCAATLYAWALGQKVSSGKNCRSVSDQHACCTMFHVEHTRTHACIVCACMVLRAACRLHAAACMLPAARPCMADAWCPGLPHRFRERMTLSRKQMRQKIRTQRTNAAENPGRKARQHWLGLRACGTGHILCGVRFAGLVRGVCWREPDKSRLKALQPDSGASHWSS
jgi:hypothetical protein